jgi:hypothetical protein
MSASFVLIPQIEENSQQTLLKIRHTVSGPHVKIIHLQVHCNETGAVNFKPLARGLLGGLTNNAKKITMA